MDEREACRTVGGYAGGGLTPAMVAEPPKHEGDPHSSKDDLHNQLPHKGNVAGEEAAPAGQHVFPGGHHGPLALSSSASGRNTPQQDCDEEEPGPAAHQAAARARVHAGGQPSEQVPVGKGSSDARPRQMTEVPSDDMGAWRRPQREEAEVQRDAEAGAAEGGVHTGRATPRGSDSCSKLPDGDAVRREQESRGGAVRRKSFDGGDGKYARGAGLMARPSARSVSNVSKGAVGRVSEAELRPRGGTLPDLSDFERVWEAGPEVIVKLARLASAETLTPTEGYTPTPTRTLDSLAESRSVSTDPSAFQETQETPHRHADEDEDWPRRDDGLVGAVGGGGRACGCGVQVGGLDETCGRCPSCPALTDVYVSEQFPSSDPLECVDGSTHTLHVDVTTGEVKWRVAEPDGKMPPPEPPLDPSKCLDMPPQRPPAPTTSGEAESQTRREFTWSSGIGEASVYHALVVIFLEFFAWGLLTNPMITALNKTFPDHTFLMNGLIMGIKGLLSFLSAPLIGALSDLWGRKFFLFITVFFTCLPIPFMKINTWWYFALISMSGVFAVTFSIVFAYVADVTDETDRSSAYGLVSATFAASLVTSPALGAYLGTVFSDDLVVGLATAIAVLDVFFILVAVPESLPEKLRLSSSWSAHISWEQADPFSALWKVSKDRNVLLISVTVLLSYLPEAGQYSCFFVYLSLVMDFTAPMVATFIAVVGILSVVAQTALLSLLMKQLSNKHVIMVGLVFEMLQLMWYGFGSKMWMMWAAGLLAAVSSITYPAISAYVSTHSDVDKQGVVQGIITGMRGLCSGLGPAVFGFIFYLFQMDLNIDKAEGGEQRPNSSASGNGTSHHVTSSPKLVPGPPFVFGALMVICALLVAAFIPEERSSKNRKQSGSNLDIYERGHKKDDGMDTASLPLMDETGVL